MKGKLNNKLKGNNMIGLSLGMAGLSLVGSAFQNSAASQAFVDNANQVTKNYEITLAQLNDQARAYNDSIRLEMASKNLDGLQETALTSNVAVERNIAGKTATRLYEQSKFNQLMTHNVLAKKAEDASVSYGEEMLNKQREANNAIYAGAAQAQANSVSTFGMISGAIGAGISGYQMESSWFTSDTSDVLSGYNSVLER